MKNSAALLLLLAAFTSGTPTKPFATVNDGRIVNGELAAEGEFPWQVALLGDFNAFRCGGSVISSRYVLTAAHCIDGITASRLNIRYGSNQYNSDGTVVGARRLIPHPEYNAAEITNDFGLIELDEDVIFGDRVKAVDVTKNVVPAGTRCTISGWGRTGPFGGIPVNLQKASWGITADSTCRQPCPSNPTLDTLCWPWSNVFYPEIYMCIFDEATLDQSTCFGDSGSPLVCDTPDGRRQAGMTSFGNSDCSDNPNRRYPSVFAEISGDDGSVRRWINSVCENCLD